MNQTGWLPGWSHFSNSITFGDAMGNLSSFLLSWKLTISLWLLLAITIAIDNKFYICSVIFIYTIYVHLQLCWRFKIEIISPVGKNWRVQFQRYFVVARVFSKRFERVVLDALYRSLVWEKAQYRTRSCSLFRRRRFSIKPRLPKYPFMVFILASQQSKEKWLLA